jgi:hypothetical protein
VTDAIGPVVRIEHDGRVARVVIGSGMRRNALRSSGWVAARGQAGDVTAHIGGVATSGDGAGGR